MLHLKLLTVISYGPYRGFYLVQILFHCNSIKFRFPVYGFKKIMQSEWVNSKKVTLLQRYGTYSKVFSVVGQLHNMVETVWSNTVFARRM